MFFGTVATSLVAVPIFLLKFRGIFYYNFFRANEHKKKIDKYSMKFRLDETKFNDIINCVRII